MSSTPSSRASMTLDGMVEDAPSISRREEFRQGRLRGTPLTPRQGFLLLVEILAAVEALGGGKHSRRALTVDRLALL